MDKHTKMTFYNLFVVFMQSTYSIALAQVGFSQKFIKTFVCLVYPEETHYAINPPSTAL